MKKQWNTTNQLAVQFEDSLSNKTLFYVVDQLIFIGTNIQFILTAQSDTSVWMAQCINLSIAIIRLFIWNFLHVFIMVISIGLSTFFKLINQELEQAIFLCEPIAHSHLTGANPILEVKFTSKFKLMFFKSILLHSTFRDIITNSGFACVKIIWRCADSWNW